MTKEWIPRGKSIILTITVRRTREKIKNNLNVKRTRNNKIENDLDVKDLENEKIKNKLNVNNQKREL